MYGVFGMADIQIDKKAEREKRLVALSSVGAAIFLAGFKLAIGLLTSSLGILSEAAHSGLDLVAAGVTLFAVRASDRPADADHPYGHGKVENFSALIETLLLLITCGWIVYEAVKRLAFQTVQVEANYWSFIVMGLSVVINITRSRALKKAAIKHGSQALEADALHFSTDVWSSWVVIAGLIAVSIGGFIKASNPHLAAWLFRADSTAALAVSGIIVYVSVRMGRRAVSTLMDSAPIGINAAVERAVVSLPGVVAVDRIRSRQSGPSVFVDMTLAVARTASLEEAHSIASAAESAVQRLLPRSDVMVHIDPVARDNNSLVERVHSVAGRQGINVHGLHIHDVRGSLSLELHAEVPENLSVSQAHELVTTLESAIAAEVPELKEITAHIEPVGDHEILTSAVQAGSAEIQQAVEHLPQEIPGLKECHRISILRGSQDVSLSFHCIVDKDMPISEAHELTSRTEAKLREHFPGLGRVVIHVEPPEAG
jgi:cation diffusion facilitator family transporter